jgi:hypothetical protein
MGEAVLVDGGQGGFLAFPEERSLLVGAQPDLLPSVGRHFVLASSHVRFSAALGRAGVSARNRFQPRP